MAKMGRPRKEFDKKHFLDLVGLGCNEDEICWVFRDESGKPANRDTLSRWCKREFDMTFQEFFKQNGYMALKTKLRRDQFRLAEKSASMAIWLGKQCLGQRDSIEYHDDAALQKLDEVLGAVKEKAEADVGVQPEAK